MDLKKLQETAKEKGKVLLIEQINISNPVIQKPTNQQSLVESSNGNQYKSLAIIRNVPVTKFTENANGRIYPRPLWENVVRNKLAEGTYCLADHPVGDSDGSVKDIVGVWRNFKLKEDKGVADLYLVGKLGQHFLETLEAGGSNGLSSVGFGELQEDEKTVDPESYELLRLSDWVLSPSQGVYAKSDNIDYNSINRLTESENYTNKKERKIIMEDTITNLTVRNNIKQAFKESDNALKGKGVSLIESKQDLKELLSYIPENMNDARSQVIDRINLVESTLKKDLSEKTKSISIQTEKVKFLDNSLTSLKEKHLKATKVIKLMSENERGMKHDIKKLMEKAGLMYSDIKVFKEDYKKMNHDIKCFKEDRSKMFSDLKKLITERKQILSDLKTNLQEKVDMTEDITILLEDRKKMVLDLKHLRKENKKMKRILEDEAEIQYPHGEDEQEVQDETYGDEDYGLAVDPEMAYMADDPEMGLPSMADDYTDKMPESKTRKVIRESFNSRNIIRKKTFNPDVIEYFESKVKKNKSLKAIKENVIKQTSLVRAISMIENYLKSQNEKPISIRRSMNESSWVGEGY